MYGLFPQQDRTLGKSNSEVVYTQNNDELPTICANYPCLSLRTDTCKLILAINTSSTILTWEASTLIDVCNKLIAMLILTHSPHSSIRHIYRDCDAYQSRNCFRHIQVDSHRKSKCCPDCSKFHHFDRGLGCTSPPLRKTRRKCFSIDWMWHIHIII